MVRVPRLPDWPRLPTTVWQRRPSEPLSPAASHWLQQRSAVPQKADENALNTRSSGLSNRDLHQVIFESGRSTDFYTQVSDLMHPTASVYIDPIFGEVKGQKAIREWLADIMPKTGNIEFELLQKPVFDGDMSYSEWRQVAVQPDGTRVVMTRGSSIRRYREGWIVYAADYFDTASFHDPAIQAASAAAGSTITLADILRYRPDLRSKTGTTTAPFGDILGLTGSTGLAGTAAPTKPRVAEPRQRLIHAAIAEIDTLCAFSGQTGVADGGCCRGFLDAGRQHGGGRTRGYRGSGPASAILHRIRQVWPFQPGPVPAYRQS